MKYAIIDIGSNSVRLMISQELVTLEKLVETTALGQNLHKTHCLQSEAMNRTSKVILDFFDYAKKQCCDVILCFATEAVRNANNGQKFVKIMLEYGINVEVVSNVMEAKLGFWGAYTDGICCVVDIGGASTELSVGYGKEILYAKSLPIGLVRIKDNCGEDLTLIKNYVDSTIKDFGQLPKFDNFIGIGGTPTSYVAIISRLAIYDRNFVDKRIISKEQIFEEAMRIHRMSYENRLGVLGLHPKRRDVIVGGGILLSSIMEYIGAKNVMARESDNQEGFLKHYLGLC